MTSHPTSTRDTSSAASARRLAEIRRRQRITSTTTTASSLTTGSTNAGTPATTSSSFVATPSSLATTTPGTTTSVHNNNRVVPSSSRYGDAPHQTSADKALHPIPTGKVDSIFSSSQDTSLAGSSARLRHGPTSTITTTPWSASLSQTRSDLSNAATTSLTEGIPSKPLSTISAARSAVGEPTTFVGHNDSRPTLTLSTKTDRLNQSATNNASTHHSAVMTSSTSHTTSQPPTRTNSSHHGAYTSHHVVTENIATANHAVAANDASTSIQRRAEPSSHEMPSRPRYYDEDNHSQDDSADPEEVIITIEDEERHLRNRTNWTAPVDVATSIIAGTTIQICNIAAMSQSTSSLTTTMSKHAIAIQHTSTDDLNKAICDKGELAKGMVDGRGLALGRENELWEILKVASARGSNALAQTDRVIRFGDTIVLQATTNNASVVPDGRRRHLDHRWVLSISLDPNNERAWHPCLLQWRDEASLEQCWVVIRGKLGPIGLVRIGESALTEAPAEMTSLHGRDRSGTINTRSARSTGKVMSASASIVVQAGDAILLRNCRNGGVLSVCADGTLAVRTDSYDGDANRTGIAGNNTDLMGRLQQHDLFALSQQELLYLFPSTVPCPLPTSQDSDSPDARQQLFCNGTYLLHKDRHSVDDVLDDAVFERPKEDDSTFFAYQAQMESALVEQMEQSSYQEHVLLDEVLGSFLGLEGSFIKAFSTSSPGNHPSIDFRLEEDPSSSIEIDTSLRNLLREMLQLSNSYANVRAFVGMHLPGYEYGMVMQALCGTLDAMLQEYVTFIGGLDQRYRRRGIGSTFLRQLQVDISPAVSSMSVLHQVTETTRYKTGGALLNSLDLLQQRLVGDPVASQVLKKLLCAAAVPYFGMFHRWIERGELDDPYDEFMIRYNNRSRTWDKRYVIVEGHVLLKFFVSDTALTKVTATGRYWNAVRASQSGRNVSIGGNSMPGKFKFDSVPADVLATVHVLYRTASRHLIHILFGDLDLMGSLRLTRKYFLLDQGDFFVNFMDSAEAELLKEESGITLGRIQHWLLGAVRLSEHDTASLFTPDKHHNCRHLLSPFKIVCQFSSDDLLDHLDKLCVSPESKAASRSTAATAREGIRTGLDSFVIDFESIPFPLSLVLTPLAMRSYQLLFRHLFYAKYVERRLVGIWHDHQAVRELQSIRGVLGATFLLRQRMLHLVQNLIYYMMLEVVEPNWMDFEHAINSKESQKEQTVDDVCGAHAEFLRKTLEACLLTSPDILRSLTKLLGTCLLFTNEMKLFMTATNLEVESCTVAKERRRRMRRSRQDRLGSQKSSNSRSAVAKILVDDMAERKERVKRQAGIVKREASSDSYCQMVARFDEIFSEHLCDFMLQLKYSGGYYQKHVMNLCTRLDYNGFVSRALGLSAESRQRGSGAVNG